MNLKGLCIKGLMYSTKHNTEEDKILATPTLAKFLPPPVRKIIGDLSDREKVLIGLDLLFDELIETEYSGDK